MIISQSICSTIN